MKLFIHTPIFILVFLAACSTQKITPDASTQGHNSSFFTLGSTMDDVAAVMGTPQRIDNVFDYVNWHYGYSSVTFRDKHVTEWSNIDNNLKVRWKPSSPPCEPHQPPPQEAQNSESQKINAQIATILAGEHQPLPPAQQIRSDPTSSVAGMIIKNNTEYTLTVLYGGPSPQRVVLAPQALHRIHLNVGNYQVAATVDSTSVVPFSGRDNIRGGDYNSTFYIETVRR